MKICFASRNKGKIQEVKQLFSDKVTIYGLDEFEYLDDIEETGSSLLENAEIKATRVYERFGVPVFADDSGLFVEALEGAPGVYSARYAGENKEDEANIKKLLYNLTEKENRSAAFKTCIAYIDEAGRRFFFEGVINGKIINEPRGSNGFGYDPIFIPDGYDQTFAELNPEEKNRISHRYVAIQKLINHLK